MITALRVLLISILDIYWWVILAAVISSWLVGFGIINSWHPFTRSVLRALHSLTEPVFGPIRRIIPPLGGLDLSPLIVLLIITFLRNWLTIGTFL
ncbi:MAG TPA: YggT family protein [Micropepsaceae bacterium]|nr:YggT family protein [Micropepsaceae bacterium]